MVIVSFSTAEICKELEGFGYVDKLTEKVLTDAWILGIKDKRFTDLLVWLCNEICLLYELDERIQLPGEKAEDFECYLLEISSLLNELECPFDALSSGPLQERFSTPEKLQKLLVFLMGHLRCARLTAWNRLSAEYECGKKRDEVLYVENALKCMGSSQPPPGLTTEQLFKKLCTLVENQLAKCKEKPTPLFTAALTHRQWVRVEELNKRLIHEYHCRMQLLLKRLDVTIQSFVWSSRIKKMEDKVFDVYRSRRDGIVISANVNMDDLLAVTSDLLVVEKVMNSKQRERTASRLNKILMADRPGDRGGRPSELRAPPPEMPAWKKDRAPETSRGGGRGSGYYRSGIEFRNRGGRAGDANVEYQVRQEYETASRRQRSGGNGFQEGDSSQNSYERDSYGRGFRRGYRGGRGGRDYNRY